MAYINLLWITMPAAVIPSLLLLRWLRNSDFIPEPWLRIRQTFYRGIWIIVPIILVGMCIKQWQPHETILGFALFKAFVSAAIPEETFKYMVLVFFCLRLQAFDEPMDGIVYGATVSLGFATFENILYVMDGGIGVALARALTSVPAHAMTGVIMGFFIGQTLCTTKKAQYFILALLVPVLLHGAYDFPLMYMAREYELTGISHWNEWEELLFTLVMVTEMGLAILFLGECWEIQIDKRSRSNSDDG